MQANLDHGNSRARRAERASSARLVRSTLHGEMACGGPGWEFVAIAKHVTAGGQQRHAVEPLPGAATHDPDEKADGERARLSSRTTSIECLRASKSRRAQARERGGSDGLGSGEGKRQQTLTAVDKPRRTWAPLLTNCFRGPGFKLVAFRHPCGESRSTVEPVSLALPGRSPCSHDQERPQRTTRVAPIQRSERSRPE